MKPFYKPHDFPKHKQQVLEGFTVMLTHMYEFDEIIEGLAESSASEANVLSRQVIIARILGKTPDTSREALEKAEQETHDFNAQLSGHRDKRVREIRALQQQFLEDETGDIPKTVLKKVSKMFREMALHAIMDQPPRDDFEWNDRQFAWYIVALERATVYATAADALCGGMIQEGNQYPLDISTQEES